MKCEEGCPCGRHRRRRCEDGCTCYRHPAGRPYLRAQDYYNNHRTVRETRGRARDHQCVTCGQAARHWAVIHGTDGTDTEQHYTPMCVSCHHAYDAIHERAGMRGMKHSDETKTKMSWTRQGKSWLREATPDQRAEFGRRVSEGKKRKESAP